MTNDQNEVPPATASLRKLSKSRHNTYNMMNRIQKIRDKMTIYPQSTLNKIVFISNLEGNGFQRQNLLLYNVPAHIYLQDMMNGINKICFNQWRMVFQALEAQPLYRYDTFQTGIGISALLLFVVFIFLSLMGEISATKIIAFVFIAFVALGCICSVLMMRQRRVDINKDMEMIKVIKKELMRQNSEEQLNFPNSPRFRWTCHKDCLWIACEFN